jgi:hypothetical protein
VDGFIANLVRRGAGIGSTTIRPHAMPYFPPQATMPRQGIGDLGRASFMTSPGMRSRELDLHTASPLRNEAAERTRSYSKPELPVYFAEDIKNSQEPIPIIETEENRNRDESEMENPTSRDVFTNEISSNNTFDQGQADLLSPETPNSREIRARPHSIIVTAENTEAEANASDRDPARDVEDQEPLQSSKESSSTAQGNAPDQMKHQSVFQKSTMASTEPLAMHYRDPRAEDIRGRLLEDMISQKGKTAPDDSIDESASGSFSWQSVPLEKSKQASYRPINQSPFNNEADRKINSSDSENSSFEQSDERPRSAIPEALPSTEMAKEIALSNPISKARIEKHSGQTGKETGKLLVPDQISQKQNVSFRPPGNESIAEAMPQEQIIDLSISQEKSRTFESVSPLAQDELLSIMQPEYEQFKGQSVRPLQPSGQERFHQSLSQNEVHISIGTIEVIAETKPSPQPAEPPSKEPESYGFEEYDLIRRYISWER